MEREAKTPTLISPSTCLVKNHIDGQEHNFTTTECNKLSGSEIITIFLVYSWDHNYGLGNVKCFL
jgi:hypothetical protein